MSIIKLSNEQLQSAVQTAQNVNFFGKRLRERQLAICDDIIEGFELSQQYITSSVLCDWLLENRPVKPKAEKAASENKPAADTMTGEATKKLESLEVKGGHCFIVTTAQNNTVPSSVFGQLVLLSEHLAGELIVLPVHYNKGAFSAAVEDEKEYFDPVIKPYLVDSDCWLEGRNLVRLMPSANVLPTAKLPVNAGRDLNAGELVTIIPATKQQMLTKPRMPQQPISEVWTTGACTAFNYTATRAGSEAEKQHVFGGLLVRISSGGQVDVTNIRQGDDGELQIMPYRDSEYSLVINGTGEVFEDDLANSLVVLGDLHCEMQDPLVYSKTLAWLKKSSPSIVALHDILHFQTRSHHNRKSGKHLYKMQTMGQTVLQDLTKVINQVNEIAETCSEVYIVESNHNSALDNWLDDSAYNPKNDPVNAKLYYLLNYALCEAIDSGMDKTAIEIALTDAAFTSCLPAIAENVVFGSMGSSKVAHGWEISQHGHKGQNGSMGNTTLFSKWNVKLVTGHTHSPMIVGDAVTVGVMAKLDQGYNKGGASSWNHANAVIHPNGTVQLVRVNALAL